MRYAVKHEYAQTAVDVIARRTRLSFLNAQAALDALPRVVDIMGQELHWSHARKEAEIAGAAKFLASMGLQPGAALPQPQPRGLVERVENALFSGLGLRASSSAKAAVGMPYSRSHFESGEMDTLKSAFRSRASQDRLRKPELLDLIKSLPGYETVGPKDYDYVLVETGFSNRSDVDIDEFVEVRCLNSFRFRNQKPANLTISPTLRSVRSSRRCPLRLHRALQ